MSEKPDWLALREQISALDAEFDRLCSRQPGGLVGHFWRMNVPYFRSLYLTGKLRVYPLPGPYVPIRIPDREMLDELFRDSRASISSEKLVDIPRELLFPKPKRGRPRKLPSGASNDLRCSERHARRLLASGKPRERQHREPDYNEAHILDMRKRRAELIRQAQHAEAFGSLVHLLDVLIRGWRQSLGSPVTSKAYQLADKLVEFNGLPAALVLAGFPLQAAAQEIGISSATLRRMLGHKLKELRRRSAEFQADLARLDVSNITLKPPAKARRLVEADDSAWSQQTTFQQRETLRPPFHA